MTVQCVTRLRNVDRPVLRLFLFHCAGGSHMLFRGWENSFPPDWELCAVEAPGRGRMADYPLAPDAASLAAFILPSLTPLLTPPFALFGHSMGALVAYDLTLRFALAGLPQPAWVGISARRAPGQAIPGAASASHLLSDPDLQRVMIEMGGTPPAIVSDPRMWALMSPILRADLRIGDIWTPPAAPAFDPPPISLFGGTEDAFASPAQMEGWRGQGGRVIGTHHFPGGHFYFQRWLPELAQRIVGDIRTAGADPVPAGDTLGRHR